MENAGKCGACGSSIGPHDECVRVGERLFHPACIEPGDTAPPMNPNAARTQLALAFLRTFFLRR